MESSEQPKPSLEELLAKENDHSDPEPPAVNTVVKPEGVPEQAAPTDNPDVTTPGKVIGDPDVEEADPNHIAL